jgi:hypothetical protein
VFVDPSQLRRAQDDEVRARVHAPAGVRWTVDERLTDGVTFEVRSTIDLATAGALHPRMLRMPRHDDERVLERHARVWAAGSYLRTDDGAGSVRGLEHPKLGAVYIDVRDGTFLHFGPEQLVTPASPGALRQAKVTWELSSAPGTSVLRVGGPFALELEIRHAGGAPPPGAARAMLGVCLPGLEALAELGLPFGELASAGLPESVELYGLDVRGGRAALLTRHALAGVRAGPVDPAVFAIPPGARDLRERSAGVPRAVATTNSRDRRPRRRAARAAPAIGRFEVSQTAARQPPLPSCHPSTLHVSAATEVRQALLDVIGHVANMAAGRLGTFSGGRVAPGDPEDTEVLVTVDWLDRLEQFSAAAAPAGDAVFCLLRDPPPDDDPLAGGSGVLDRLAASLAAALLAADEPLPLGGDDPVVLPQEAEDAVAAVAADPSVAAEARFEALGPTARAAVREAVLRQRLATVELRFDGDFGEHVWPAASYDLVHVGLQLEQLTVAFERDARPLDELRVVLDDDGRPRIAFAVSIQGFDATIRMDRRPGLWFWITATGALVAAGVVATAVGELLAILMGLGPFGLAILLGILSAAPLASLASVAGGALLLAAVTYLVWDASDLRVQMADATVRSSLSPGPASGPDEVVLDPGPLTIDGELTVSVASEIPTGIHQLFDWIAGAAMATFDAQVRDVLEDVVADGLGRAIRRLPHLRLPQPTRIAVPVPVVALGGELPVDHTLPEHVLLGFETNGVEELLLAAAAHTTTEWPYAALRPHATQVELDGREALAARMGERHGYGGAVLGYALSQNLLNAVAFTRWLSGRLAVDYDAARTTAAFAQLAAACPACADVTESRTAHVWAAAAPEVLVTPRGFDEDPRHHYLLSRLPDVRVCLAGVAGKRSSLELQFAVTAVAHVTFGAANSAAGGRTLFTAAGDFLDVRFDDRPEAWSLSPVETQGVVAAGPGFAAVTELDEEGRTAFLRGVQPLLEAAAARLLGRHAMDERMLDAEVLGRQHYDGMFTADIAPRGTSLDVIFALSGGIVSVLPARDADGVAMEADLDLEGGTCADGVGFRAIVGRFGS